MSNETAVEAAAFVAALVKDPNDIPELMMVVGYPGESAEEGHTRLYQNAELSYYYDIPNEAILHQAARGGGDDPLGTTYFWVKRDAPILRRHRAAGVQGAAFLHGAITGEYLSPQYHAQHPAQPPQYGGWPTLGIACTYTPQTCPPVGVAFGPTGVQHCTAAPQYCGNTAWQGCPPQAEKEGGCPGCGNGEEKKGEEENRAGEA